jgi:signal-transduction protein with cAMP-binding, CBS, and nucleotidyltransferase domain
VPAASGPQVRLEELQLGPLASAPDDATLVTVAQRMIRTGVSVVVIGRRRGIVTERDLVAALARGRAPTDLAIHSASSSPWAISCDNTALDALAAMVRYGVRHLLVLDGSDELIGVVALGDLLGAVFGGDGIPQWLTGLRLALHPDPRRDPPPER